MEAASIFLEGKSHTLFLSYIIVWRKNHSQNKET
jgi:hypothetical protein